MQQLKYTGDVLSAQFNNNDDARVITGSNDKIARIWNVCSCKKLTLNQWALLLMLEQAKKNKTNRSLERVAEQHGLTDAIVYRILTTFKQDQQLITKTFIKEKSECVIQ